MRLAVVGKGGVGKGGAGKTVLVAPMARALAERGRMVLAVDLDFNPGLAVSFGLDPSDKPLPQEAIGAGPTGVFEGYARTADLALVAAEPTVASAMAAERILALLRHEGTAARVVLTKSRGETGAGHPEGEAPIASVPFDPEVQRLERSRSLAALPDDSPALRAVRQLVADLESR